MTVLVGSDRLIEVTRVKDPVVLKRWLELGESQSAVLCSDVSVAELWGGAQSHEYDALTKLFRS